MKYVQVDTLTNNVIGYIESSFVLNDKQEGLLIVPDTRPPTPPVSPPRAALPIALPIPIFRSFF